MARRVVAEQVSPAPEARGCLRLPHAPASLGQSAVWAAQRPYGTYGPRVAHGVALDAVAEVAREEPVGRRVAVTAVEAEAAEPLGLLQRQFGQALGGDDHISLACISQHVNMASTAIVSYSQSKLQP